MSLKRQLGRLGRLAARVPAPRVSRRPAVRPVLALQRVSQGKWESVRAEVGGERIVMSDVRELDLVGGKDRAGDRADLAKLANGAEVVLVSNSSRSVCRLLDVAEAPPDMTRRMVSLRLETELPYPVQESTWACERQSANGTQAGPVLVAATAAADVAEAEDELRARGISCDVVELNTASLAELAVAGGSSNETLVVISLDSNGTTLCVAESGWLRYARSIPGNGAPSEDRLDRTVSELHQSLHDCLMRTGQAAPTRVLLVGAESRGEDIAATLSARLGLPVVPCPPPDFLAAGEGLVDCGRVCGESPACVGALVAAHKRARGERAVAPPLRVRGRVLESVDLSGKRVALAAGALALLVVLIAALFGVRAAQLRGAERVRKESLPLLRQLDGLEAEVGVLQDEARRSQSVLDAIQALSEALPETVRLDKLSIDSKGTVLMSGQTKTVEEASEKAVAAMVASPSIFEAKFLGASKEKDGYKFQLSCRLRQGLGGPAR